MGERLPGIGVGRRADEKTGPDRAPGDSHGLVGYGLLNEQFHPFRNKATRKGPEMKTMCESPFVRIHPFTTTTSKGRAGGQVSPAHHSRPVITAGTWLETIS